MSELILHHYDVSPYAEKIRLAMGLKGLAWRSVHIPMVMPKPDLTALTGGYRLTPVLQVGADVYCDTRLIAAVLEERVAEPSFFPEGRTALTRGLAFWGESAFMEVITLFMGQGVFPQDFVADRQTMIPGGFHVEQATPLIPSKRDQIRARLDLLEGQLAAGAPFLMGDQPSLADPRPSVTASPARCRPARPSRSRARRARPPSSPRTPGIRTAASRATACASCPRPTACVPSRASWWRRTPSASRSAVTTSARARSSCTSHARAT
jgi:glutathione S-transferase